MTIEIIKGGAAFSGNAPYLHDFLRDIDTSWFSQIRINAAPGLLGPPPYIALMAIKTLADGYQMQSTQQVLSLTREDLKDGIRKALEDAKTDLIAQGAPE